MKQIEKSVNQKKLRIILFISVAALWTLIFFRVYKTFFSIQKPLAQIQEIPLHKPAKKTITDTFSLKLDYPDPFLKGNVKTSSPKINKPLNNQPVTRISTQIKKKQSPDCVWEEIKYGGLIKNNAENKKIALLRVKGKSFTVRENDLIKEYSIKHIYRDSIILKKENCTKTFYKAI